MKSYDAPVTITPEGNAVVNVYYDRNEYTLQFQINSDTYIYTVSTNDNDNDPEKYGDVNGNKARVYWRNGAFRTSNKNSGTVYNGTVYTRSSWQTIKSITALYEQNISNNFPIVGTNGVTYDNGERWKPQSNNQGWTQVMVFIETMPSESITFRLDTADRPLKTMYYYVEALPTDTENIVTRGGVRYKLYNTVKARYNGVTEEDFVNLDGFTKKDVAGSVTGRTLRKDSDGFYIYNTYYDQSIYFFYSRNKEVINYMDGVYVDGNNNHINETNHEQWATSGNIYYQADISSYNKGGANFYEPARAGYVFEGWYLDDACTQPYTFTTMPKGGVTVYAKWRQIQYRVFLHPNVPTSDSSFEMGGQETSFRVNNGEKIAGGSAIYGTRDDYDLIGWYTDEGCTKAFNFDAYTLNETNVTTPYDQTEDTELNKYGNSNQPGYNSDSDNNRFWITKKIDLYAKWRAKLPGAKGIQVIYSANDTKNNINGTNAPTDPIYYLDSAEAIAGAASTPSDNKYQFLHWVVQTWDEISGKYVDTDKVVYPGASFEVLKANAQQRRNPEWTGESDTTHD